MTWTRLDDVWTDLPVLSDLPHTTRWHYLAMIQYCSRTALYDGIMKVTDARRCSDVEDPAGAVSQLIACGLIHTQADGRIKVDRIDEHIPPPSVRENSAQSKVRMTRMRAHKNGDHSKCLPDNCEHVTVDTSTGEVTGVVTRNTGTGQDGTGALDERELKEEVAVEEQAPLPSSPEPCFSCGARPAVVGSECRECSGGATQLRPASPPASCPEHGYGRMPSVCDVCRGIETGMAA